MPRLIDPPKGPALDLEEVTARLDESGVDLTDEGSIARCADLLAGLQRNPDFLADRVIAALKASYADQLEINRYSAQVFLLHRSPRGYYLRANLWPSARDAAYTTSGLAAFAYGLPHDHNFSFLTAGYFGPGYVSDYYEVEPETVDGRLGEPLDLNFVERSSLSQGKMMLYRAHRDIHSQLPPKNLSVSLNIMDEGDHVPWRDQYIVDLEAGTIAKRPTLTSGEMLLRCAVHLTENGRDVAEQFTKAHLVPRVRRMQLRRWRRWRKARVGRQCWNEGCAMAMRGCATIANAGWHYNPLPLAGGVRGGQVRHPTSGLRRNLPRRDQRPEFAEEVVRIEQLIAA